MPWVDESVLSAKTPPKKQEANEVLEYLLQIERLESREVLSASSTPLNDLGAGLYNGEQGGLYPNSTDTYFGVTGLLSRKSRGLSVKPTQSTGVSGQSSVLGR